MSFLPSRIESYSTPVIGKTRGGEANVERILDAALSLFSVDGFMGARVDAIADIAGISKPNLLYYFRTKADLYLAVLRRTLDMWQQPLNALGETDDPKAALAGYIRRKLEFARDYPEASRLFAIEVIRGAPILCHVLAGDMTTMLEPKVALLRKWMCEGQIPNRDPHHLLFMLWATTQHYADFSVQVEAVTGKSLSDPAFFEATCATLVDTFCGP